MSVLQAKKKYGVIDVDLFFVYDRYDVFEPVAVETLDADFGGYPGEA
jgi:hypothetical protein